VPPTSQGDATGKSRHRPPVRELGGGRGAGGLPGLRPLVIGSGILLAVGALYLGRSFLLPVAVAALLTFLLNPVVRRFETFLPRGLAVSLVVLLSFSLLGGLGWALMSQAARLGEDIPTYRDNLKRKAVEVRGASRDSVIEKVQSATKEVVEELRKEEKPAEKPLPVVVRSPSSTLWSVPGVLEAVGHVGLVLVLVIFMLLERLQLRDRLIRLIGVGRIATTTKAMDDAAGRITNYLTMQTLVNGTFGLCLALGLLATGLPYVFLWGFLAAVLRFIPYVGPWVGALVVTTAGLAAFDGWARPLLVAGLFITLELVTGFVVETYLYSQSAGVSQVALLLAVAFWTWIWGPLGLALATPLTVCLVVLAKYVPGFESVTVLLTDEPTMAPDRRYYQRLVARDENEAEHLVRTHAESQPSGAVDDEVMVPALNLAQRDHQHGRITDADWQFVVQATRELIDVLTEQTDQPEPSPLGASLVLAIPARDEADEATLMLLRRRLDPSRFRVDVASPDQLASEAVAEVQARAPGAVVVGALAGTGHVLHLRYLCKRLRTHFPDLPIILGWWGADATDTATREGMLSAGASRVAVTIAEACAQIQEVAALTGSGAASPAAGSEDEEPDDQAALAASGGPGPRKSN
jgi:predicted PurR-regulated permease PerM